MKKVSSKLLVVISILVIAVTAIGFAGCTVGGAKTKIKVVETKLAEDPIAFATPKTEAGLETKQKVDKWIKDNKATIQGLFEKYAKMTDKEANETNIEYKTTADPDKKDKQFVVATAADYPPYEFKASGTQKILGVDIEIASMIAKELKMELVVQDMEFDAIIEETKKTNSLIDIAMAGLTENEERKKSVYFTETYTIDKQVMIVNANNKRFDGLTKEEINKKINQMAKQKVGRYKLVIGAQKGTSSFNLAEDYANENKKIEASSYPSPALAVQDLKNGRIDFVIVDELVAKVLMGKFNK